MSKPKPASVTSQKTNPSTPVLSPCTVPYRWIVHVGRCVSVYFDKSQPKAVWPKYSHPMVQILAFGVGSECTIYWEEKQEFHQLEVKGPHLWILGAGVPHHMEWNREALRLVFYVEPQFVTESTGIDITGSVLLDLHAVSRCDAKIPQLLRDFEGLDQPETPPESIRVDSLTALATVHILGAWECMKNGSIEWKMGLSSNALARIDKLVERRMDSKLALPEMAREVNMSVSNFVRLFKRSTGDSPGQYLIKKRIHKSKSLLINSELRIGEVAYSVGFSNQGHFDLFFKRSVGMTPSEYRAMHVQRGNIS
jgi:AraC-like DNA-binding protein